MNKNIPYYIVATGLFILLKFWFGSFENEQLIFLLKPTDKVFELVSGTRSVFDSEVGYYNEHFNIVIDKSCSGYNFLLLCFLMLYFQIVRFLNKSVYKWVLLPASFTLSCFLSIVINSSRILISVLIQQTKPDILNLEPHVIHEATGVITYLSFLLITYLLTEKLVNKKYAQLT